MSSLDDRRFMAKVQGLIKFAMSNHEATESWKSYTPTISNVTTSNVVARYQEVGGKVHVDVTFTLTASPTGTVTVSLPTEATPNHAYGGLFLNRGHVTGLRQGSAYHNGAVYLASTTTVSFLSSGAASGWAAGSPVAWANTDIWSFFVIYEKAS